MGLDPMTAAAQEIALGEFQLNRKIIFKLKTQPVNCVYVYQKLFVFVSQ